MGDEGPEPGHPPDPRLARAAELSLQARTSASSPEAGGAAFRALRRMAEDPAGRLADPSQRLRILAVYLDTCRVIGQPDAMEGALRELAGLLEGGSGASPDAKAQALASLAGVLLQRGRYEEALAWSARMPEAELEASSIPSRARLLSAAVQAHLRLSQLDEAETLATRILALVEQGPDAALQGTTWGLLATISKARGCLQESHRLYNQAARMHRLGADRVGEARDNLNRGWLLNRMGLLDESLEAFEEVRRLAASMGHARLILLSRLGRATIRLRQGAWTEARALSIRAIRDAGRAQMPRERCLAQALLGEVNILLGRLPRAARALALAHRTAEALDPQGDIVPECTLRLALLAMAQRAWSEAEALAREAVSLAERPGLPWESARGLLLLGMILAARGEVAEARSTLLRAEGAFERMDEQLEIRLVRAWLRWLEDRARQRARTESEGSVWPPLHVSELAGRRASETGARSAAHPAPVGGVPAGAEGRAAETEAASRPTTFVARVHPVWNELGFVTRSEALIRVLTQAEQLARREVPTLILGETGTGKEYLARGIHILSGRKGLFVPFNCAGCPEGLIESELFGSDRGAFTSADRKREGLIAKARGGTLFLDEVGDLRPETQGALLRFLDRGEVRALGSVEIQTVPTRVLAATHRPLRLESLERQFRPDLYYRLSQSLLRLPALRERLEDLDLLIESVWPRIAGDRELPSFLLSPAALEVLRGYGWPGNVRELMQILHRVLILCEIGETVDPGRLAEMIAELTSEEAMPLAGNGSGFVGGGSHDGVTGGPAAAGSPRRRRARTLPSPEEVQRVVEECQGEKARAMQILGISRATLYRLLRAGRLPAP